MQHLVHELSLKRRRFSKAGAKVLLFFDMTKFFSKKMQFRYHFFILEAFSKGFRLVYLVDFADIHHAVVGRNESF